jgi:hypothetical protein
MKDDIARRHGLRSRWQTTLLLLTLPIWFLPFLLFVGWREAGAEIVSHILPGIKWAITGKYP